MSDKDLAAQKLTELEKRLTLLEKAFKDLLDELIREEMRGESK